MIAALTCAGGVLAGVLAWAGMRRTLFASPLLARTNHRGTAIPVATGIVIVIAVLAVAAVHAVVARLGTYDPDEIAADASLQRAVLAATALGLLGLLDDLVGSAQRRGFRGHLGALRQGEVTTGLVKLVGGCLVGALVAASSGFVASIRGGLIVAAAANLANLLDRAPGRVIKASLGASVLLVVLAPAAVTVAGPLAVVGAALALLVPDLRERCMLGDTGANVLGGAIGAGFLVVLGIGGQWVALAVLLALNLASEVVSFSRVIDAVAPLRWLDRLGALPR